jgi:ethanolamine utilization microcompartment shell protein EutL
MQDTEISETGPGFDKVWKVKYMVDTGPATGTQGEVVIPAGQHNAETVKMAIDAAVYHLDQVAGL